MLLQELKSGGIQQTGHGTHGRSTVSQVEEITLYSLCTDMIIWSYNFIISEKCQEPQVFSEKCFMSFVDRVLSAAEYRQAAFQKKIK